MLNPEGPQPRGSCDTCPQARPKPLTTCCSPDKLKGHRKQLTNPFQRESQTWPHGHENSTELRK